MTKLSTIFCAQLAVSAVMLSIGGAANAQDRANAEPAAVFTRVSDIGCVDNTPAPPFTHSCPPVTSNRSALAAVPQTRAHARHKKVAE
jgi:hypothetical protein